MSEVTTQIVLNGRKPVICFAERCGNTEMMSDPSAAVSLVGRDGSAGDGGDWRLAAARIETTDTDSAFVESGACFPLVGDTQNVTASMVEPTNIIAMYDVYDVFLLPTLWCNHQQPLSRDSAQ